MSFFTYGPTGSGGGGGGSSGTIGVAALTVPDANVSLSSAQAANSIIIFTGTCTAVRTATFPTPASGQSWDVFNKTDFPLHMKCSLGEEVTVQPGTSARICYDGANMMEISL